MSTGFALMEQILPYYPDIKFARKGFRDYNIPSSLDVPSRIDSNLLENPAPKGPLGAKGCGEIVANAIGVRFYDIPITPERILRALAEKESK